MEAAVGPRGELSTRSPEFAEWVLASWTATPTELSTDNASNLDR